MTSDNFRGAIAFALIALGFVATACDKDGPGASSPGDTAPLLGNPAPDFDLTAQSGASRASLESGKGKVMIVDFWATWCAPCLASFPKYEALARKYGTSLVIVGISEDDEAGGIPGFAKETGATFPLAWDSQKGVAESYHPESMPTSFILDKNGLVRFVHSGFRAGDERQIDAQIKSLME